MNRLLSSSISLAVAVLAAACAQLPTPPQATPAPVPLVQASAQQLDWGRRAGIEAAQLNELLNKPLYKMKPAEVSAFLAYEQLAEPSLRKRIASLARKNIGQPYELFLLGEFPYETYDSQPLFQLEKSDCVVFAEHTYAMALSTNWEEFFWTLQRIRYRDGVIGTATRNHYTEADWNTANSWLVKDITADLAGSRAASYTMMIDRKNFLKKQFKIDREVPVQRWDEVYVPKEMVAEVAAQLQDGDFVNIISGRGNDKWASHVGLIVTGPNGERHLLHSAEPQVREETLQAFIARSNERDAKNEAAGLGDKRPKLYGFKFLRLNEQADPPPMAPQPRPARRALAG